MGNMGLIDQLPRLSAYDPGATGEGGLDPLGLGAIADRIANVLVPGLRARMYQPRYVTVSAVGAIAYQSLHGLTADHGKTTADIAFEWIVVEGLVRHTGDRRTDNLPGSQKAARAKAANERLSRRTYLSGPRVFGFTGVYRPFSRDAGVLTLDDLPAQNAVRLAKAWERDYDLPGYTDGVAGTRGGRLRSEITNACRRTLEKAECTPAGGGNLLRDIASYLAPRGAMEHERRVLRELIATGEHDIRNELAAELIANPLPEDMTQRDMVLHLMERAKGQTLRTLVAAFDYEEAATALDYAFRRFLAFTTQQHGCMIDPVLAAQTQGFAETAPKIGELVQRAIQSVDALDDAGLSNDTRRAFREFERPHTPVSFLDALIARHEAVQASKKKLSWLDQFDGELTVRIPYRNQNDDLNDKLWTHPMRVETLSRFLRETA